MALAADPRGNRRPASHTRQQSGGTSDVRWDGRPCERLADDHMLGVAFVVRLLRDVSIQRRDLLPYLAAYLQEVGTLSNDASTVITQGIRLSIGDVGSVHARILLAVRYLEIKENFRL